MAARSSSGFRLLAASDVQGALQPGFRLCLRCPCLLQEQDAPQATDFGFPAAFLVLYQVGLGQRLEAVCCDPGGQRRPPAWCTSTGRSALSPRSARRRSPGPGPSPPRPGPAGRPTHASWFHGLPTMEIPARLKARRRPLPACARPARPAQLKDHGRHTSRPRQTGSASAWANARASWRRSRACAGYPRHQRVMRHGLSSPHPDLDPNGTLAHGAALACSRRCHPPGAGGPPSTPAKEPRA